MQNNYVNANFNKYIKYTQQLNKNSKGCLYEQEILREFHCNIAILFYNKIRVYSKKRNIISKLIC